MAVEDVVAPAEPAEPAGKSLAWRYWVRVVILVVGVAAAATWVARRGSNGAAVNVDRTDQNWGILLLFLAAGAVGLVAVGTLSKVAEERPYEWLQGKTWRLWLVLFALAGPTAAFGQWARPSSGPNIIRLELAGSQGVGATLFCANRVIVIDPQRRVSHAGPCQLYPSDEVLQAALRADYAFIVGYVLVLFLLVRWAGCYFRLEAVRRARVPLSWAVVAAGAFDVAEDLCLRHVDHTTPAPGAKGKDLLWELAATCAWAKFAVLLAAVGFVACGAGTWLFTPRWVRIASWHLPKPSADTPGWREPPGHRFTRARSGSRSRVAGSGRRRSRSELCRCSRPPTTGGRGRWDGARRLW